MYGDSAAMRKRSGQLRDQATDVRAMADRLVGQIETSNWEGRAGADLRARVHDRAAHLRECADAHEAAAESLDKHVAEVDRRKDTIAEIERRADSLVADARNRVARLRAEETAPGVVVEPTEEDRILDQFEAPKSGHKDWLTVNLPGL